jgi:hypothetical protein
MLKLEINWIESPIKLFLNTKNEIPKPKSSESPYYSRAKS